MAYLPAAEQKAPEINAAIESIRREMAPAVQYIRYEVGQDWSGDWAIFFRVVLSDDASKRQNLRAVAEDVERKISEQVDFPAIGVRPYFNYRSQSEQATLREPAWA
jgi:hypothetical protein